MFESRPEMKRPMRIMLITLSILFGTIFIYKAGSKLLMTYFISHGDEPTATVSTITVKAADWQPKLKASANIRAVKGVNVTAQLGGMIQTIYFTPGATVNEGDALVQQNADPDVAQLHSLEANAELAKITFQRDKAQYKFHAVSKQQVDADEQNLKSLIAQVAQQKAIVAMKTITAPFSGRLGISQVNPGQYLNPGDKVVMLQTLDPLYADFYLPQQSIAQLETGQHVQITSDAYPGKVFTGKITTIDPAVDNSNRNIQVEATIDNPTFELAPGMFTTAEVDVSTPKSYLTVPQAAISFNPYGDIAYLIKKNGKKDKKGKPALIARQSFVTTGETRGDQVTILEGLKEGDVIVTSGQLKLKNNSRVTINNTVQPSNSIAPEVPNDH